MKKVLLSIWDAWCEARQAYAKRYITHRLGS